MSSFQHSVTSTASQKSEKKCNEKYCWKKSLNVNNCNNEFLSRGIRKID